MTLKSLIESQATSLFLNENHFAQQVTRHINGDSESEETVTAIVVHKPHNREMAEVDRVLYEATLTVAEDQSATKDDHWVVEGNTWVVDSIGEPEGGLKDVSINRAGRISTERTRGLL